MTNYNLIHLFLNKYDSYSTHNMSIYENKLIMYSTVIAEYTKDILVINNSKYSRTTSKYQNYLLRQSKNYFNKIIVVTNVPLNSKNLINGQNTKTNTSGR